MDFIVAGVQKAGTTAIHDFLAQHPQIALLRDQALHFFDKKENFHGDPDYRVLLSNFDPGWRWRTAGEVTADYLYYPRALERIAAYNPKMKIIIALRHPTERAFSQWNMRREKNQEPLEFIDALKRDQEIGLAKNPRGNAYIARSLYAPQLEKVFSLFPREQVLVLKYETFRTDPFAIVDQIFDFIGVEGELGFGKPDARSEKQRAQCWFLFAKANTSGARIRSRHFCRRHHEDREAAGMGLPRLAFQRADFKRYYHSTLISGGRR